MAGLDASNALLDFIFPKAPKPVAGLTSGPLPNPLDVVSVLAGAVEKDPNILLRALGSVGVAVPSPKLPNPAVESDIDASRVMLDDVVVVDVSVLWLLPPKTALSERTKLLCPNALDVPPKTPEGAEPKALVPGLPKALLEPPKAPNPAAGFAAKGEALV